MSVGWRVTPSAFPLSTTPLHCTPLYNFLRFLSPPLFVLDVTPLAHLLHICGHVDGCWQLTLPKWALLIHLCVFFLGFYSPMTPHSFTLGLVLLGAPSNKKKCLIAFGSPLSLFFSCRIGFLCLTSALEDLVDVIEELSSQKQKQMERCPPFPFTTPLCFPLLCFPCFPTASPPNSLASAA